MAELFRRYDAASLGAFRRIQAETKADGTTVTAVDRDTSRLVVEALQAHTPDFGVISEEEAQAFLPQARWKWVVDPLDGTASFARGYPVWGLGIGLLEGDQARQGYLRFPALDETYTFDGVQFAFNGRPVAPLREPDVQDTHNYLIDSSLHRWLQSFAPLRHVKLRVFGSALYHLVSLAMGRAEAMICGRIHLWDLAAALPMTRAQGFTERYVDGSAFDLGEVVRAEGYRVRMPLVFSTPERIDDILARLQSVM